MKYLQVIPAPSPIESWLHSQLEARGVDRVYSRYILSLFQSTDPVDQDFLDLDIPSKELKRLNKKSTYHHYRSSHCLTSSRQRCLDPHRLIRASVIETLRSVAETKDSGIETLVDELCDRLHSNERSGCHSNASSESAAATPLSTAQSLTNVSLGVVDLAQKYYDAFPALGCSPNARQSSAALLLACCTARPSPWNGKHKHLLSSSSSQSNLATFSSGKTLAASDKSTVLQSSGNRGNSVAALGQGAQGNPSTVLTSGGNRGKSAAAVVNASTNAALSGGERENSSVEDKENQQYNQSTAAVVKSSGAQTVDTTMASGGGNVNMAAAMDHSLMSVKRKLFVEVEEPSKDSLASLMEKVDGTKDLWGGSSDCGGGGDPLSSSSCLLPPFPLGPLSSGSSSLSSASGFIPCGTNLTTSIWSEVEQPWGGSVGGKDVEQPWGGKWSSGGAGGDDSGVCLASPPEELDGESAAGITVSTRTTLHLSTVLNHHPEKSAFKAVVPGSIPPALPRYSSDLLVVSVPPAAPQGGDENLLTSSRTHFCPIDKAPHYKTLLAAETVQYANGTTFSIASTMDEVDYHVGQDGTLTWDSAVYMEFKANGLTTECYNLYDPFKPKFRVSARGDKAIQTEDQGDQGVGQCEQVGDDGVDDFYFPGEESIARDIMRSLEEGDDYCDDDVINPPSLLPPCTPSPSDTSDVEPPRPKKPCSPLLLDAWAVAWPPFSIWSNTALASRAGDGWPTPSHDYQELSGTGGGVGGNIAELWGSPAQPKPAVATQTGLYTTNYSIWAPPLPLPLDSNSNLILCTTSSKCETPLPLGLGVNMGNLKISSDRKRRHSSSQYLGSATLSSFPCIKSEAVSFFQQSITL
uniref:Uncharacterized protein KIAA0232 n=1 Tax=Cacopsylla melanoneura TaxID=428564 RepID=A0A8D8UT36_9HEMI